MPSRNAAAGFLVHFIIDRRFMSFREIWNGPSFLNRKPSALRMAARDELGKKKRDKKGKLKSGEHFAKNWDKDLWD